MQIQLRRYRLRAVFFGAIASVCAEGIAATDYNNDQMSDIAFHRPGGPWNSVPTLFSRGDGAWTSGNGGTPSWANQPGVIAISGDYDGDGRKDLAFHRPGGPWNSVPVLFAVGNGDWNSANAAVPSWANQAGVIAIPGDFNGDSRADIAFHRPGGAWNSVPVLLAVGNGTWQWSNFQVPEWANQPNVVAVPGDFDNDGRTDIAFHRPGGPWSSVPVLFAQGNGGWKGTNSKANGWANQPDVIAIPGDYNSDGRTDIAFHRPGASWATVPVLFAAGGGNWSGTNYKTPGWANQPRVVAIPGDYNGDGLADIAFHRPGEFWQTVPILFAKGQGDWNSSNSMVPSWANQAGAIAISGDYNNDGRTDIAFHRPGGPWSTAPVLFAAGNGSWNSFNGNAPGWANQPGVVAVTNKLRRQRVSVVNLIPNGNSGESNQDSEPNLAVNPANPHEIAASAFTPNPAGIGNAPIFVSENAGETWRMNPIVQSNLSTGDITLRFTRTTNRLYAGILRKPGGLRMSIQSTDDFTASTLMTVLVDRGSGNDGPDQPYVQATDVGSQDRIYVGNNDLGLYPGKTASVDQSIDNAANFTIERIESRSTNGQDLPPVRPAIGPGNVIYTAYLGRRSSNNTDVVVLRDDNGATGTSRYQDLTGSDGLPGVRVVTGRNVPFENYQHPALGQERLVSSDLSIAVDPRSSARVCVAWGDRQSSEALTLHLRCSTDSGSTWSTSDIDTITNAKNPALAFNANGTLGFLYQAVETVGGNPRWVTHFERWTTTLTPIDDTVLATTPANTPNPTFLPYIGDYVHLMALDRTFYGIFSANNTPDFGNFPQGVTYQREANFSNHTLLDLAGNSVDVSIDPFFFTVRE